jgi:hypothetical protein
LAGEWRVGDLEPARKMIQGNQAGVS